MGGSSSTPISSAEQDILLLLSTWQDADSGYTKPTLIPYHPVATLQVGHIEIKMTLSLPQLILILEQVPSNVIRISRALRREDFRGKPQIIFYQSGVGSSGGALNRITGGIIGFGINENIREAYAFITTNYIPGDEIILIGFSRGAFTARAVAGLVSNIGLLTRHGMAEFPAIFRDNQNWRNPAYHDLFPDIPFSNKPWGPDFLVEYRRKLIKHGLTRVTTPNGTRINVQAVAVWETVGSLGIPALGWMQKMGFPNATEQFKFFDTSLSNTIRHAFQALALDEHRGPFAPAIWEKREESHCSTDLRQVWFAGAHANVGGGYDDQEIANVTLAWMMDQLASIGLEFQDETIDYIFEENRRYYLNPPRQKSSKPFSKKPWKEWAIPEIYEKHNPVRPWGLGKIYESETGFYHLTGRVIRTPGQYKRVDPHSGLPTNMPMTGTNERIHSSVRIRLELEGLDVDDIGLYKCQSLLEKGPWELSQVRMTVDDPIHRDADWGGLPAANAPPEDDGLRWIWEYVGPEKSRPSIEYMVEEKLGPYERRLLLLNKGMLPPVLPIIFIFESSLPSSGYRKCLWGVGRLCFTAC
ncbi:MAG: hypothetical protein M1818_006515 [Claussenomyces sp. TS43310]|nr:MAG: hypothetical protein M1818_006515 [Claussenomyces sp. TS43310]